MKQFSINKGKTLSLLALTLLLTNNHELSTGLQSVEAYKLQEHQLIGNSMHSHSHSHSHHKKKAKKKHQKKNKKKHESESDSEDEDKHQKSNTMVQ